LIKAASGKPDEAAQMFNATALPAEKQPEEVRRAYIEVQLQKLLAMGRSGNCSTALDQLFLLGNEDPSLPFTLYGFEPFMRADHFQYYAGVLEAACHDEKNARKRWSKLIKHSELFSSIDYVFPILASVKVNPGDGAAKITAGLEAVRAELQKADEASRPRLNYFEAMLLAASGNKEAAIRQLQPALGSSDLWVRFHAGIELQNLMN